MRDPLETNIRYDSGEWEVWIGVGGDPAEEGIGFVVGLNVDRNVALAEAVSALEATIKKLQMPQGDEEKVG